MDLSALDPRLIDLLPAGVFACDAPSGAIRWYNRRAAEVWGRAPVCGREALRDAVRLLRLDGSPMDRADEPLEGVLASGRAVRDYEVVLERPDGSRRTILLSAEPVLGDEGEPTGAIAVFQDVTDRRRAEGEQARLHRQVADEQSRLRSLLEQLHESRERLRLAVESAALGTWDLDPVTGRLTWSARCKELFGLPADAVVDYDQFLRVVHPEDRQRVDEAVRQVLEATGGGRFSLAYRTVGGTDGVPRWLAADGQAYFDSTGRAVRFIGTVRDITEPKRLTDALRSREAQFRTLVEQSPLSIQIVSPEGRTLQVNRAWEELWGLRLSDLSGYNMLCDQQLEELGILPYIRRAFGGEAVTIPPIRYDRKRTLPDAVPDSDPEPHRWVRAYAYPVSDESGQIHYVVLIHEDVTARQRLENELQDRLRELAENDRHKDQFLAMLAHELRNPIAALSNALQVMELSPPDSPAYRRARATAHRQVNHQRRLVDDLLDVSRIDRGKIQIRRETLDLAQVVRDTVTDQRPLLEGAQLRLEVELPSAPVRVVGDAIRLSQVLWNLLDNSRKFTPQGGTVAVRLEAGETGDEHPAAAPVGSGTAVGEAPTAVITVRDTGIGLDPAIVPYLFEPFRQADASLDRSRGGLGLGLALVRGLIELHGGTVSVTSDGPGRGCEFRLVLPLAGEEHGGPPAARTEVVSTREAAGPLFGRDRQASHHDVVLIEDNRDSAESLHDLLEMSGFRVRTAFNGPDGLELVRASPDCVVICDIGLPGMDGYQVARLLRDDPSTAHTPLVALTGYGGAGDRERAREAGFDVHLVKPVEPEELERVLNELFRARGSR